MKELRIIIGKYDKDSKTVPVSFAQGGIIHSRRINACHDDKGRYDSDETAFRVDDIARGIAVKIAGGVNSAVPKAKEPVKAD